MECIFFAVFQKSSGTKPGIVFGRKNVLLPTYCITFKTITRSIRSRFCKLRLGTWKWRVATDFCSLRMRKHFVAIWCIAWLSSQSTFNGALTLTDPATCKIPVATPVRSSSFHDSALSEYSWEARSTLPYFLNEFYACLPFPFRHLSFHTVQSESALEIFIHDVRSAFHWLLSCSFSGPCPVVRMSLSPGIEQRPGKPRRWSSEL